MSGWSAVALHHVSLDEYVQTEVMTEAQYEVIKNAVSGHRNILVIGGTGSGKTTLVNAIMRVFI